MKHTRAFIALGLACGLSLVGLSSAQGSSLAQPAESSPQGISWNAADAGAKLRSPISPLRAARLFDPPPEPWKKGHRGIDLLTTPAGEVRSPGAGVVVFAGYVVNRPVISIDLDIGLLVSMEPVANLVPVGQRVTQGQLVGTVDDAPDAGHCEPDWCVHWGVRRGETYVNPLDWVQGYGPITLLPVKVP